MQPTQVTASPDADLMTLVLDMLTFPRPTICRHYVAAAVLQILEKRGHALAQGLAKAVVTADDESAIALLKHLEKQCNPPS